MKKVVKANKTKMKETDTDSEQERLMENEAQEEQAKMGKGKPVTKKMPSKQEIDLQNKIAKLAKYNNSDNDYSLLEGK